MINSVRNTVLSVLNKNNYGYISPSDFNLYAKQAQLEIFEDYFASYNRTINLENSRMSGTDYADERKRIEEAMEVFAVTDYLDPVLPLPSNSYYLPSVIYNGNDYFMLNKVMCYTVQLATGTNTAVAGVSLIDSNANFIASVDTSFDNLGSITNTTGHCFFSPGAKVYWLKQKHSTLLKCAAAWRGA